MKTGIESNVNLKGYLVCQTLETTTLNQEHKHEFRFQDQASIAIDGE